MIMISTMITVVTMNKMIDHCGDHLLFMKNFSYIQFFNEATIKSSHDEYEY